MSLTNKKKRLWLLPCTWMYLIEVTLVCVCVCIYICICIYIYIYIYIQFTLALHVLVLIITYTYILLHHQKTNLITPTKFFNQKCFFLKKLSQFIIRPLIFTFNRAFSIQDTKQYKYTKYYEINRIVLNKTSSSMSRIHNV